MALLSPHQIRDVLRETTPTPIRGKSAAMDSLTGLLEKNNLTPDEILDRLRSEMCSADQASVRLGAAKVALQLNGLLDSENQRPDFHVTINIIDSEFSNCNPILIPR